MLASLNNDRPSTPAGAAAAPVSEISSRPVTPVRADTVRAAAKEQEPQRGELENAVETLNKFTDIAAQDVRFSIDEESGKTIVKVVDTATQTVLRQIPNAEALAISRSLDKMQGLLVRDSA